MIPQGLSADEIREYIRLKDEEKTLLQALLSQQEAGNNMEGFAEYVGEVTPARHHKILCEKLDRIVTGDCTRLIVCAPPGSAKSTYTSLLMPAYFAGKTGGQVVAASHTIALAETFGRRVRGVVQNPKFRMLFPDAVLDDTNKAAGRWAMANGGSYYATGVGGSVTGRRANLIIVDDPYTGRADANSPTRRKVVEEWFFADLYTRLLPGGRIVLIQTRWHQDDLAGVLLRRSETGEGEPYELVNFQALCESPDTDPLGRSMGEPLWPEWQPLESLMKIKSAISSYEWNSLYQQRPSSEKGDMVQREWFQTHSLIGRPDNMRIIQSWDTASVVNQRADPSVCLTLGQTPTGDFFVLDLFRKQVEFPELLASFHEQARKWTPNAILVEAKGSGQSLLQTVKGAPGLNIIPIRPQLVGDKEFRFSQVTPMFQAGRVFVPNRSVYSWVDYLIDELSTFPSAKHDDIVDAFSQALSWAAPNKRRGMAKLRA